MSGTSHLPTHMITDERSAQQHQAIAACAAVSTCYAHSMYKGLYRLNACQRAGKVSQRDTQLKELSGRAEA